MGTNMSLCVHTCRRSRRCLWSLTQRVGSIIRDCANELGLRLRHDCRIVSQRRSRRPAAAPPQLIDMHDLQLLPQSNRILSRLHGPEFAPFLAQLKLVTLRRGEQLYETEAPLTEVYFLLSGSLSLLSMMSNGDGLEVASLDKEGCYPFWTYSKVDRSPYRVVVQAEGKALRADAATMRGELSRNETLRDELVHILAMIQAVVSRTAACNGLHTVLERCCRWLLELADRTGSNELSITHEFIALALGVRRPSVTDALAPLHEQGILNHRRGKITIVARDGLERGSCECYGTLKENLRRLLGPNDTASDDRSADAMPT